MSSISDGFGNSWARCKLGRDCGLCVVRPGAATCWCYTAEDSRDRVGELAGEVEKLERYVAALEEVCTREQRLLALQNAKP